MTCGQGLDEQAPSLLEAAYALDLKGSISFGLVNIPVAVYPATKEEKVSFKQLRKKDLSPIKYKKVAEVDDQEVPSAEIVKGYEYEKGKWVTLTDEDFDKVQIESTHSIEITDFVEQSEIPAKFFYKPYFLEAQKGGEKGYALLLRAMTDGAQVGIAKVAIRSREYLAAVKADGLFLMLELMHFAQEILEPEGLRTVSRIELSTKELAMAKTLMDSLSTEWKPEQYSDRYQEAVREVIDAKIAARPITKAQPAPAHAAVDNILAILQQSLEASAKKGRAPVGDPRRRSTAALVKQKRRTAA